jgi:hypothetical protein
LLTTGADESSNNEYDFISVGLSFFLQRTGAPAGNISKTISAVVNKNLGGRAFSIDFTLKKVFV